MAAPWKMATAIFSFGCETYKQSGCKGQSPTTTPIKHKTHHLKPRKYPQIHPRFYSLFWRNKPRHALSLQTGSVGARKGCFYLFPLCSEGVDEKIVKSSIFRKKQVNF